MINAPTTLVIAICAGIAVFAVVGWLIERRSRQFFQKEARSILDDWNQSTAMWSELSTKLADENVELRKEKASAGQ